MLKLGCYIFCKNSAVSFALTVARGANARPNDRTLQEGHFNHGGPTRSTSLPVCCFSRKSRCACAISANG